MSRDIEMDQHARFHGVASSDQILWPGRITSTQEKIAMTEAMMGLYDENTTKEIISNDYSPQTAISKSDGIATGRYRPPQIIQNLYTCVEYIV